MSSAAWGLVRRRRVAATVGLLMVSRIAWAADGDLPVPTSMREALAAALARKEPLVTMASLVGCPFCRIVREHYLLPLLRSGAAIVQIDFRDARPLSDWQGHPMTQGQWVKAVGVSVAPTVMFFAQGGREVAERLSGTYISDFYGAYLDERMAIARDAVRA